MANRHVNNPSLAGWLPLAGQKWPPVAGQVRSMHKIVAPAESIAALTTRMARGEEAAFRDFHEAYFHRLFHYLLVASGGVEDLARDALQGTLLRVVRHARRFDSEEAFWCWLTVLTRSALADEQRKRRRYRSLLERFFDYWTHRSTPTTSHSNERHLVTVLEQNLAALAPDDRALLERKYFDHQPVRSIAIQSGCTEKAVESRLARLRQQLKQLILTQLKDEDAK